MILVSGSPNFYPTPSYQTLGTHRGLTCTQEEVPEGSQTSAAAQNSSRELPMRAQSAGADSDHSPSWEAASAPDVEAGGSRRSDGAASGALRF